MLRIETVNEDNFEDVPSPCKYCLYWQTSGPFGEETLKPEMEQEKREWFNEVNREFGGCIKIAYLNGKPIAFMQYASARFFPRAGVYASGPPSEDAVFLACLYISDKEARRQGHGSAMLKDLTVELKERGFKAVETYARKSSDDNPSGPLALYLRHDFRIERDKNDFPLVRLEL